MLAYWFARKNADDTVIIVTIFITGTNQVSSITNNILLYLGSPFTIDFQLNLGTSGLEIASMTNLELRPRFAKVWSDNQMV